MRRYLALLSVAACAVVAGCGGDGDDTQTGTVVTRPPTSGATAPAGTSVPSIPPPASGSSGSSASRATDGSGRRKPRSSGRAGQAAPRAAARRSRRVLRYIRKNFTRGDTPDGGWASHVERVSVAGSTTSVQTNLSDDREGNRLAEQICANLRGALPGLTDVVRVTGTAQQTIARCVP